MSRLLSLLAFFMFTAAAVCVQSSEWSDNEIHYQKGDLDRAYRRGRDNTTTITFQHASGWKYGATFLFIDHLSTQGNSDLYGEFYTTLSLAKISGKKTSIGPLSDIGVVFGVNVAADANVKKYLPGMSFSWEVPGFNFFTTLVTAYIDDSKGDVAPREGDSYMLDWSWDLPFQVGRHSFSVTGHMEYIHRRKNEFGATVESWLLSQPQLRYDLGKGLFKVPNHLFIGIEYQYWHSKLGDKKTNENAAQILLVWKL